MTWPKLQRPNWLSPLQTIAPSVVQVPVPLEEVDPEVVPSLLLEELELAFPKPGATETEGTATEVASVVLLGVSVSVGNESETGLLEA